LGVVTPELAQSILELGAGDLAFARAIDHHERSVKEHLDLSRGCPFADAE
jgi:hypothetical protein